MRQDPQKTIEKLTAAELFGLAACLEHDYRRTGDSWYLDEAHVIAAIANEKRRTTTA